MKFFANAAMALALSFPATAIAATDGTLGPTSTGTFGATLTINDSECHPCSDRRVG